jgi:hypothetical protein
LAKKALSNEKRMRKMLMKLTTGEIDLLSVPTLFILPLAGEHTEVL